VQNGVLISDAGKLFCGDKSPNQFIKRGIMADKWEVMVPGLPESKVDTPTLQMLARSGRVKPNTLIKDLSNERTFSASEIPGVFSEKSYTTALILSVLVGVLGVDRFYTGHVGLGIVKLLTLGGCGVWALIDLILYATRKVTDSNGAPLS
jgi:hypothetical protein